MKIKLLSVLFIAAFLTACGTLDQAGVYGGDKTLYQADLTINTSYQALDAFVTYEYTNRALLVNNPEITKYADYIRKQSPRWFQTYFALRSAYVSSKRAGDQQKLLAAVAVIQAALTQATAYLAEHQTTK